VTGVDAAWIRKIWWTPVPKNDLINWAEELEKKRLGGGTKKIIRDVIKRAENRKCGGGTDGAGFTPTCWDWW